MKWRSQFSIHEKRAGKNIIVDPITHTTDDIYDDSDDNNDDDDEVDDNCGALQCQWQLLPCCCLCQCRRPGLTFANITTAVRMMMMVMLTLPKAVTMMININNDDVLMIMINIC